MSNASKVAVVTGGAQGIGRAIVQRFANEGYHTHVLDRDATAAAETVTMVGADTCTFWEVDLRDRAATQACVAAIGQRHGQIDALVNNAGTSTVRPFLETPTDEWDFYLEINLVAAIATAHAAYPFLRAAPAGAIVNISSDAARVGSKGEVVYAAAKAGLLGLSKTLAREWAQDNIRVNVICPGPTRTPLNERAVREQPKLMDRMMRLVPMRRLGEPAEVAAAVYFLSSSEASFVTGQVLSVSGGLTMAG